MLYVLELCVSVYLHGNSDCTLYSGIYSGRYRYFLSPACFAVLLVLGELLYCLESVSDAENLIEQYDLPLYVPSQIAAEVSYALLLP